ncbi:caM kinase-like vesicle-associated protein isoform X1 [Metopolophium dirhodum]|uniref:caM kinase-like vesicle-associated protein isoform X1 n=1 Tax=Metopolophium dirhodum TaxID=44670 RepID=UPI0029903212|nr:caM kinase-like vesicle-associated protein isoform X1 [Metopolophium dirhodum]XP_060871760.1 caM kinase-like vesicle-associated protein isoform X1 [Metopolophium dirhodum]
MIKVDESDPIGELEPSFPFKDITIRRGVDMKEHYELQSEIGRGKFGTVFKCREKATSLMLAAKFVGIVHKQDRRNVEREVEIMCELQHPRLIQLYDAFEANNAMCFILELVEGGELFERVIGDDFVLTEKAVTIFMRQICEGVQFIHSKNILHLDLKPENILCLTKTGNRIKIIDFGLARKFNPENKLQVLFGTPEFVAPEVVNFDAIGFGTDMWSVGVICYVLLSGLSPFMGETDVETMSNVTIAQYDFDDEAFDSISNDAKDFIKKLLVKDHKSRLTATECLSHRWMQKKKPKKMVRKSSSKKLVKQIEEKTKQTPDVMETAICTGQDAILFPLDVSKENLKELCSKSRSQSPLEIATVSPTLAQLRILQKDSKTSKTCGNDDDNMPTPAEISTGKSRVMAAIPLNTTATTSGVSLNTAVTTSGVPQHTAATTPSVPQHTAAMTPGVPQHTAATTSGSSTGVAVDTTPEVVIVKGVADRQRTSTTTWSQTTFRTMTDNANCSNNYRRASDVSYTFSNFRTSSAAASSSNFLGQELRDLQTMMLGDRSEALQQDSSAGNPGSSLHKLLLNRQHLTAAVADRKPKFKFSSMNRDVPTGSPPPVSNLLYYMTAAAAAASSSSSSSSACRSAPHSKRASPEHESTSAREMLLKLFYGGSDTVAEPNLST